MQSPSSCSAVVLLRRGACADLEPCSAVPMPGAEILQMLSSPGAEDPTVRQKKKVGLFCRRLT